MQDAKITTQDVHQPDPTPVTPVPWFKVKLDGLLKLNPQPAAKVLSVESMETLEACMKNGYGICGFDDLHVWFMHACMHNCAYKIFQHPCINDISDKSLLWPSYMILHEHPISPGHGNPTC